MAKALLIAAVAAVLASVTFAHGHGGQSCASSSSNVWRASTCAGYVACQTALCGCVGSTGSMETCLSSTTNCTTFTTCTRTFFTCLGNLANMARNNQSDACNAWAASLHAQMLATAVGNYNGSSLQAACSARACELKNRSMVGSSCDLGTNYSAVCMSQVAATPAPSSTVAPQTTAERLAIRATLRLSGDWTAVLANATAVAELRAALTTDIAAMLQILARFIRILSLRSGSLIVDFAVTEGSNATAADLNTRVAENSGSTTWLTSTTAAASAAGGPSDFTVSLEVTTTTVAGQTAAPSTTSSASAVSAALVAAAAVLALVF